MKGRGGRTEVRGIGNGLFFIFKHLWAPERSWKIFHGFLESPGKVLDFLSARMGTLYMLCLEICFLVVMWAVLHHGGHPSGKPGEVREFLTLVREKSGKGWGIWWGLEIGRPVRDDCYPSQYQLDLIRAVLLIETQICVPYDFFSLCLSVVFSFFKLCHAMIS